MQAHLPILEKRSILGEVKRSTDGVKSAAEICYKDGFWGLGGCSAQGLQPASMLFGLTTSLTRAFAGIESCNFHKSLTLAAAATKK